MLKKIKELYNYEYIVKRTYREKPYRFIFGVLYVLIIMGVLFILVEHTTFFETLFSPLGFFKPYIEPYFEPEMTIIGWIIAAVVIGSLCLGFAILLIPGIIIAVGYQRILDSEWPDDPERTQKWRDKLSPKEQEI